MYPAIALVAADGIDRWMSSASEAKTRLWRSWWVVALAAVASCALAAVLTRGMRERLTSRSTTSGIAHADKNFLPLLRAEKDEPVSDPVLLCDDSGQMELPAALFYTGRHLQQVWLLQMPDESGRVPRYFHPLPLKEFVDGSPTSQGRDPSTNSGRAAGHPRLLIIRKESAAELPPTMRFEKLREAGDLEIGLVSLR
jgi:hypothetical protein